jgi:glycosyltransferase involved in cell wall biosynthesis
MSANDQAHVSVIVPAHNAERYLAEALESVMAQSDGRLETIVVDDASADGNGGVAASFGRRGVTCLSLPRQRGIGGARNAGIAAATGDLLAFLDADDLWPPARTGVLLRALQAHGEGGIAIGHVEHFICPNITAEQRASLRAPPPTQLGYFAGTILLRRSDFLSVGGFDEDLVLGEFIDWFSRARHAGLTAVAVPEIVLRRRMHDSNQTLRQRHAARDYLAVVRREIGRKKALSTKP